MKASGPRPPPVSTARRVGAVLAVLLILGVWFGSLWSQPAMLQANVIRVIGALVGAGIAWFTYDHGRRGLPWQRCLAAGVAGSLVATGLSVFIPDLGEFTFAGWLASGAVGGASVVLLGYAWTGAPRDAGSRRDAGLRGDAGSRGDGESQDGAPEARP